jgi:hypothetical protein
MTNLNGGDSISARSNRTGFETSFQLHENLRYARIAALTPNGSILGYTKAVDTVTHGTFEPGYPVDNLETSKKQISESELAQSRYRKVEGAAVLSAALLLVIGSSM